jgi:hypothetical protein
MIDMLSTCSARQIARISLPFGTGDYLLSPTVVFPMEVGPNRVKVLILVKCDAEGRVYAGCGDGIHVWSKSWCPLKIPATDM